MICQERSTNHVVLVQYDEKLCGLLEAYDKCFIVHADNVGSRQFMDIRRVSTIAVLPSELVVLLLSYIAE